MNKYEKAINKTLDKMEEILESWDVTDNKDMLEDAYKRLCETAKCNESIGKRFAAINFFLGFLYGYCNENEVIKEVVNELALIMEDVKFLNK